MSRLFRAISLLLLPAKPAVTGRDYMLFRGLALGQDVTRIIIEAIFPITPDVLDTSMRPLRLVHAPETTDRDSLIEYR